MPIIAIIPNVRFLNWIFGGLSDYSKFILFSKKKRADYCDYSEYSVSKPNIRPSIPIIQKLFFFLRKNMPIIAIIPNIRFLNWIFGRLFRLFKNYFFFLEKLFRLLRFFRIFEFQTEYSAEYSDYSFFIFFF